VKKLLLIPALFVGSLAIAKPNNYETTLLSGYVITEDTVQLDYYVMFGGEFQFNNLIPYISPEISFLYGASDYIDNDGFVYNSTDIMRVALNGVYDYRAFDEYIVPFVKGGLGYTNIGTTEDDTNSAPFVNLTLGIKSPEFNNFSIKLEYSYIVDLQDNRKDQNHAFFGGLSYSFGEYTESSTLLDEEKTSDIYTSDEQTTIYGDDMVIEETSQSKTVSPVQRNTTNNAMITETTSPLKPKANPNDLDGDGVPNYLDKCTKTAEGEEVDSYGCKLDTDYDMDGVKDSIDKCIYTPEGVEVYSNGCKVDEDSDEDGIKDSIDKCMFTPLNAKVYTNGCRIDEDSDGDGIKDSIDECAKTPKDTKVGTNGCSLSQASQKPHSKISQNEGSMYKKILGLKIMFRYKSFDVTRESQKSIDTLIDFLANNPSYDVKVAAYTDNVGSARYNKKLSQKRANRVKELIVEGGIPEDRVYAVGLGENNPIAENSTSKGRAKNRRIEIILIRH